ncbi:MULTISPECIES: hypothetical protein [Streptomyces]|uniref:Uncharacterized protein n=3 Tax=Streptomyces TaxID=1883 RepID=A0A420V6D5_9ACTN|nr:MULTISPECIES: hypothetical protein [Streptomyces]OFA61946.1 hypothetical protein BEN35_00490 [Streptomyces fradiae]PQM24268.1 hypothetical protein Sfr7A_05630 [Streptomyces xinghaiensis]RKM97233.1 hypothetical protein SFRA_008320 [Streptomyces xinghaiensis]RNC75372.1 hypothetical protein DC095_006280 [Streptomyces xinghaiensis]
MKNSGRGTVTALLTVICGLLLSVLGLCFDWPGWAWGLLAVLLPAVSVLALRTTGRRGHTVPPELAAHLPLEPVERREQRVTRVALPSEWDDYDFLFSATVRWFPADGTTGDPLVNPGGLAVDTVLDRARAITEKRPPGRASLVQHELNGALGWMTPDATGQLRVMAESVTLTLSEPDQERLDKLASVRKDKAVWEHERTYEQSRREYLGKDVLQNTGSAVVWWLTRNDDQVEKTVGDIGLLAQLSSAANNEDVPDRYRPLVPHLAPPAVLDEALPPYTGNGAGPWAEEPIPRTPADHFDDFLKSAAFTAEDPQCVLLAEQMADLLDQDGKPEAAEALRWRFGIPSHVSTPDAADEPGIEQTGEPSL